MIHKQTLRERFGEAYSTMPHEYPHQHVKESVIADWWLAELRTQLDTSIKDIEEIRGHYQCSGCILGADIHVGTCVPLADILTRLEAQRDLLK